MGRDRRKFDRQHRTVTTSSFSGCGKCEERNVEVKRRKTTIPFTAGTEKVHMLMKVILIFYHLCRFLSAAQILDDQPNLHYAVTESDLKVSEMEIYLTNAERDPTQVVGRVSTQNPMLLALFRSGPITTLAVWFYCRPWGF